MGADTVEGGRGSVPSSPSGASGHPPSVLVVDDDESILTLARRWLEKAGLMVDTTTRGSRALEMLAAAPRRYAAVVLDIMMPDLDGFTVLSAMQADAEMAAIPVVLLTAHGDSEQDIVRGIEAGALDHLSKPFRGPVLVARIRSLQERRLSELSLRERLEDAERAATTDSLTGLANRRQFQKELGRELAYVLRHREPLSLLFIDIDHFKAVNDTFGHPEGDRVLVHLAAEMIRALRQSDRAFRIGGEEFALLLRDASGFEALAIAERLRRRIKREPFEFDGGARRTITFSGGVASADETNDFWIDDIVTRADQALYRAKQGGRDRTELEPEARSGAPRWSDLTPAPEPPDGSKL